MKSKLIALFIATSSLLAGCDRNDDDNPIPASKKLVKITETHQSTDFVSTFQYNSIGQLSLIKDQRNNDETNFIYDASGNVSKIEVKGIQDAKTVYEYAYKNGVPETGTIKMYSGSTLNGTFNYTYKVENGLVTEINQTEGGHIGTKSIITYQNENVAKIETIYSNYTETVLFSYGTKKNMFGAFKYILDKEMSVPFFAKNEITKVKTAYTGNEEGTETNSAYTYDSDGYPLTATSTTNTYQPVIFKYEYQ